MESNLVYNKLWATVESNHALLTYQVSVLTDELVAHKSALPAGRQVYH